MNKEQEDRMQDYFLHTALHLFSLEERYLKKQCAENLSLRELHVLEAVSSLRESGHNTMAETAAYLHLSPASLTTAAGVLVRKGYLGRIYSPTDRRVIFISLTEAGEQAVQRYLGIQRETVQKIAQNMDEETAEAVLTMLDRLRTYLEAQADGTAEEKTPL